MSTQDEVLHEQFARRLRTARANAGMSQRELSEALGISHTQVARYERGNAMPRPGVLVRMAEKLGTPLEHLRDGEPIQLVELERSDGSTLATVSFSQSEFSDIERAAHLSGVSVEDVIKNILLTGMGKVKR